MIIRHGGQSTSKLMKLILEKSKCFLNKLLNTIKIMFTYIRYLHIQNDELVGKHLIIHRTKDMSNTKTKYPICLNIYLNTIWFHLWCQLEKYWSSYDIIHKPKKMGK